MITSPTARMLDEAIRNSPLTQSEMARRARGSGTGILRLEGGTGFISSVRLREAAG